MIRRRAGKKSYILYPLSLHILVIYEARSFERSPISSPNWTASTFVLLFVGCIQPVWDLLMLITNPWFELPPTHFCWFWPYIVLWANQKFVWSCFDQWVSISFSWFCSSVHYKKRSPAHHLYINLDLQWKPFNKFPAPSRQSKETTNVFHFRNMYP